MPAAADAFERLHVAGGGFDGQLFRQQKIARVAGLHVHDVAAVAELFDVFLENYFLHLRFLFNRILLEPRRLKPPNLEPESGTTEVVPSRLRSETKPERC